ncbi:HTTM domain-containing protein [Microbacterium halotolerans]|uniref:HTTM domain-containing protein n=1 Tax=Microbacterium halotolerans TaxID=246613 RepID=UPI000E6AE1CD|nr:HTTM domain-containing protein [Microbacterium halotolerans]
MTTITDLWNRLCHWLLDAHRGSYGIAVMRIGFGLMTIALILMFLPDMSYSFGEGSRWGEAYYRTSRADGYIWPISDLFTRSDSDAATLAKTFVLVAIAVAYTLGWRMRVVSPLFVVMVLGFASTNPQLFATGHHQTLRVMLIFLLLADTSRVWSLDARRRRRYGDPRPFGIGDIRVPDWFPVLANNVAVVLIGAQLCIAYLTSSMWKLQGKMWGEGMAVYYALRLDELALFPALNDLIWPMTPLVIVATFAAVYGQLVFPVLLLNRWTRIFGLVLVTGMHAMIAILLALPWFSLVMILGDMIFVRTVSWRWLADRVRPPVERLWLRATAWLPRRDPDAPDRREPDGGAVEGAAPGIPVGGATCARGAPDATASGAEGAPDAAMAATGEDPDAAVPGESGDEVHPLTRRERREQASGSAR